MVIGVIVAVGIVYQFVKVPKVKEEIQTVAKFGERAQTQKTAPTLTATPAAVPNAPSVQQAQVLTANETQPQTEALLAQNSQNQVQIQQLQTALQQLQASMQQMSSQVARCNAATSIAQVQPPVVMPVVKPKVIKITRKAAPPVTYHVRAVVPGRAWLLATNGKLITVKVGDALPGYGNVERISPELGIVWTRTAEITYKETKQTITNSI